MTGRPSSSVPGKSSRTPPAVNGSAGTTPTTPYCAGLFHVRTLSTQRGLAGSHGQPYRWPRTPLRCCSSTKLQRAQLPRATGLRHPLVELLVGLEGRSGPGVSHSGLWPAQSRAWRTEPWRQHAPVTLGTTDNLRSLARLRAWKSTSDPE